MIDEKQIVYSKESLVDIKANKSISETGTVKIAGGQITLGPKSSVSYEYNYEVGQNSSGGAIVGGTIIVDGIVQQGRDIITDILQLNCSVIGLTQGMNTRYNRYLSIIIKVQYYLEIVEGDTKTYYDGNTDTFEIYPYLSHESNNTLYNIALQNSYIKKITITYKNDYESDSVKYNNIKLKYSMSLLEAINKYGGGSTFVPGSDSLKFYSVDGKYSIDSYGESLIMKIGIDENNWEEVVKPYIKYEETIYNIDTTYYDGSGLTQAITLHNPVQSYTAKIRWTVRSKSDRSSSFSVSTYGTEQIVHVKKDRDLSNVEKERLLRLTGSAYDIEYKRILNSGDCWSEMKVIIDGRYCKIIGYETDTLIVRAEYIDAPNIYFEQEVKINNCSVVGFEFNFESNNNMEIHGSDIQFANIDIIPSNIKSRDSYGNIVELSCMPYAENGEPGGRAVFVKDNGSCTDSIGFRTLPAKLKIKGINNGKVLFTAITKHAYPSEFSKSWIAEVSDVEDIKIWIDGPDVLTSNTDIYNYTIRNSQGLYMFIDSNTTNYTYESIKGGSIIYDNIDTGISKIEPGFNIRANTNGKVILKINVLIAHTDTLYTITKEVYINVEGLVGPIINIKSSTGINKVAVGGTLTLTADWINAPSGITKKYEWLINNIDSTASVTKRNGDYDGTYITVTGKAVGRVCIVCKDSKTLETYATYELEVVENIDEYALPVLTSDTGDFVIDTASGELIITPSHATETVFTYEQMYVDGGEVIIEEYDNYCKLIGKEDGTTRLKVTTASGLNAYQNIIVANQYPQGVRLVTSDGSTTIDVGETINVFAKPSNNVDTKYDLYSWTYEKIDSTAEVSLNELVDGQVEVTGVKAGHVRVVCISVQNGSILASIELEVIDEIPELISDTWDLDVYYDDTIGGNVVAASQIIVTPKHSTETVFTYKQMKSSSIERGEISIESFGSYCVVTGVKEGSVYLYVETSKGVGTKKEIYVNRRLKDGIYDYYGNAFTVDGSKEDSRLFVYAMYKHANGGFEFTEVYTDESIIDIITKDALGRELGNAAIIEGKKDGITTLRVYKENAVDELVTITVKNMTGLAHVIIQTSSEKVLIDGTIIALADLYDDNYNCISEIVDSFIWGYDIVDPLAEADIQCEKGRATVTGKALGRLRLTCICKDGKSRYYIGSKIIEVVESL